MKSGFPIVGMILLLLFLNGCGNGSEKKVEESVSAAEKRSVVLKSEIDYSFRLEKYYSQAFSAPDKKIVSQASTAYSVAKKNTFQLHSGTSKELLLQRLGAVDKVLKDADWFKGVVDEGNAFILRKKEFANYIANNPLSPELKKKTNEFITIASALEKKKNTFDSESFKLDYENLVLSDSIRQIEKAQKLVSIQQKLIELNTLISEKQKKRVIENKIAEISQIIADEKNAQINAVLNAKKTVILHPYFVRLEEEKRIAQELARKKAARLAAYMRKRNS